MGGIIAGFLNGAGQGAAIAGQMMLADKLATEREEANFLRDSALKMKLQTSSQEYNSSQGKLDREHAAKLAETRESGANTRNQDTITSREGEGEKDRANAIELAKLKPEKNKQLVSIDGGNGLVIDAVLNDDGVSYTIPTPGGADKVITPGTASRAQAAAEWKAKEAENKNMIGMGGQSGAEEAAGMTKKEYLDKRSIEIEMGVEKTAKPTVTPDVSRETSVAPDTGDKAKLVMPPEARNDPNKAYKWLMEQPNADPEKAKRTVQAQFGESWSPTPLAGNAGASISDGTAPRSPGLVKDQIQNSGTRVTVNSRQIAEIKKQISEAKGPGSKGVIARLQKELARLEALAGQ